MWVKYRNESNQTVCIIGVLILSTKLCTADGHFSITEEEEILKIIPHEPRQRQALMRIMEEASVDEKPIEYHALELKRILGIRHPDFLEFVVAVLYRLAMVDHIVSIEEERDIRKVADVFNIKKTFTDKAVGFFDRRVTKINVFIKNVVDKLNAKSK